MKKLQQYLTNERLKGKFRNNFDLANFGIKIAKEYIEKGDEQPLGVIIDQLAILPSMKEIHSMIQKNADKSMEALTEEKREEFAEEIIEETVSTDEEEKEESKL